MCDGAQLFLKYCEPYKFESDRFYSDAFIRKDIHHAAQFSGDQTNADLDGLTEVMSRFLSKAKSERERLEPVFIFDARQAQPTVNFCMRKLVKYLVCYSTFVDDFFLKAAHQISLLIEELGKLKREGVYASCTASDVEHHFTSIFEQHPFVVRIVPKIQKLQAFINRYRMSVRMPEVPIEHIRAAMKESAARADESIEYSAHGFYDDFLFCFVMSRRDFLREIDELVKGVIDQGNGELTDFRKVESLVAKMVRSLKPISKADVFVVRCGIVRIFFDRLYLISNNYLRARTCSRRFTEACETIRNLTPRAMGVSDYLMSPDMLDIPFLEILEKEEILQDALKNIQLIQFYTNPVDIMACVLRTLKSVEKFVRMHVSDPEKDGNIASQMSFDDFFPMFCMIFSIDPPVNAYDVSHLLSSAVGLITSSAMEFAKMFFTSSVEYIEHSEDEPFSVPKEQQS